MILPLVRKVVAVVEEDGARTCSRVSELHSRLTAGLLLLCCGLVSTRQYFGQPLYCLQSTPADDDPPIPENVMNTFCFVTSTYSPVPDEEGGFTEERRHSYYQWVPVVLALQVGLVTAPRALWATAEGGLMTGLLGTLLQTSSPTQQAQHVTSVARYLEQRLHHLEWWSVCSLIHEFSYLPLSGVNFFLTDVFLGGEFLSYGLRVWDAGLVDSGPMEELFPKLTKCDFYKYGSSGAIENHGALCLMTLNIVNEKIYLFLWFWLLAIALLTAVSLLIKALKLFFLSQRHKYGVLSRLSSVDDGSEEAHYLMERLHLWDLIFLEQMKVNLHDGVFKAITRAVCHSLVDTSGDARPNAV